MTRPRQCQWAYIHHYGAVGGKKTQYPSARHLVIGSVTVRNSRMAGTELGQCRTEGLLAGSAVATEAESEDAGDRLAASVADWVRETRSARALGLNLE